MSNQSRSSKHADILIIGGGAMGSSAAYFLKSRSPNTKVVVVERDPKVLSCVDIAPYFSRLDGAQIMHSNR